MQQPKGIAVVLGVLFGLVVVGAVVGGILLFKGEPKTQTPVANTNIALQLACSNDADCISYCGGDPNYQPICGVTAIGATGSCTCRSTTGSPVTTVNTNATTNTNVNVNANGNVNASTNANTNSTNSESKTYSSAKFGLSFTYAPTYANKKVLVKETVDTIYVYTEGTKAESGQFVRKFTKGSSISLKTAIEQKFLQEYSSSDCFVVAPDTYSASKLGSNWDTARISYPPGNTNATNPWAGADKCPKTYTTTNGISYFAQSKNDQTKFFFYAFLEHQVLPGGG